MASNSITPSETHSLNKILACFELQREWRSLSRVDTLTAIGFPFDQAGQPLPEPPPSLKKQPSRMSLVFGFLGSSPRPPSISEGRSENHSLSSQVLRPQQAPDPDRLPLFRLLIQRVWGAFPGLIDLPIEAWLGIERFIVDFNRRNFSTSRERRQFTKRAVISIGFTKLLSSYITSIIRFQRVECQPTRPAQEDIDFISQLPRLVSSFGSRIKLIARPNEEYLVIYRQKTRKSSLKIDSDPSSTSGSKVKISLIGWPALLEILKTVDHNDHNKDYDQTPETLCGLQNVFNSQHPQSQRFEQVLESHPLSASLFDDEKVKDELREFLNDEQQFQEDWINTGKTVYEAKQGYKKFLQKIVYEEGELDRVYDLAGKHEKLETILELDPMYQQAQSWVIMWIGYMLHFVFISGPDGDEVCELLIKVDRLLPYELIKQGLRIINPTLAIKSTIALILGQPFGSLSLFQRILDSIVSHETRTLDHQIEAIVQTESSNNQPMLPSRHKLLEAIKKFVYLGEKEKRKTRAEFAESEEDIVILILRWSQELDEVELEKIEQSERTFKNSNGPVGPNLFHDLIMLLRLTSLKRDREQISEMILEPDNRIIRTIKQILENYYPTIYKIAQASDLSKKFGQTEHFLKDLIQLLTNRKKQFVSVDKFVTLLHQHKQSYWSFVNELVRYQNLCVPMKEWIRSCFDLVKLGLTRSAEESGTERFGLNIQKIASRSSFEAVRAEARSLSAYNQLIKMVDNMHYRTVFCSPSPFTIETDFLNQVSHLLSQQSPQFVSHLAQSNAEQRSSLPFGWAWWIDEKKLCDRGGEMLRDNLNESHGVEISSNEHLSHRVIVNSDLKELEKLAEEFYQNELMKSLTLFDRPPSTPVKHC